MEITKKGNTSFQKKRSRIIKFLYSWIPEFFLKFLFPETPRMYISSSLVQDTCGFTQNLPSDDSNSSFNNFKPNFQSRPLQEMYNSTPKRHLENESEKLKAVQQQLDEIKQLVARLVEMQSDQCSGHGTLSYRSDQLQRSFVPPPPPPPPPPLPENLYLSPVKTPLSIKKNYVPNKRENQFGLPCGKELLRDLKKVRLKKIEKSPGGGPLKKSQFTSNDPGGFLAEALKKRFGRLHNSPDTSLESASGDSENSFTSGNLNSSYKLGKNKKSAILSQ